MRRRRRLLLLAAVLALLALGNFPVQPPVRAYPTSSVELQGHGWGHGRGLGQWGSFGYAADRGWTHEQILDHYYGGTTAGTQGDIPISVQLTRFSGQALVADSEAALVFVPKARPEGQNAARVHRVGTNRFEVYGAGSCAGPWVLLATVDGPVTVQTNTSPGTSDHTQLLRTCEPDGPRRWFRGTLQAVESGGTIQTVNHLPMEQYLRGVVPRESPASWGSQGGQAALRAQSVAARSYATAENRSSLWKTCDTISCQVYGGVKIISGSTVTQLEHANTDNAVAQTAGLIRRTSSGGPARTEFSSSTGGWTAGGVFPAVIDEGDSTSGNPNHNWTASVAVSDIEAAYPSIGTLLSVDITNRNGLGDLGGRVLNMVLRGSAGEQNLTGDQFRSRFGLKSNWFAVASNPGERPAVHRGNSWFLRAAGGTGPATSSFVYGDPGDVPLMCDWDGDGSRTPGIFRHGVFHLRNFHSSGGANASFGFGNPGDTPVCGDWDGDGDDTIGVVRGNEWFLRNENSTGAPHGHFFYGNVDDVKVVGNWDGPPDPYDSPGVVRGYVWYLRDSNFGGDANHVFGFGDVSDKKIVGDWDLNGGDGPGVVRAGQWFLRNSPSNGPPDTVFYYGNGADRPLVWH